jgi:hypothetical protein
MKNILLILLALIVMPAWAADAPPAPTEPKPAAQTAPAAPDTVTVACPVQCQSMNCPPPNGVYKLCCPRSPYTQTCP